MERIAVFPGSFDPVTLGHVSVVRRALPLFDKIIISIGANSDKKSMFTLEQRMNWLNGIFREDYKVEIKSYSGLTVEFCKKVKAKFILRGLRTSADFEFERGIGQINRKLSDNIETVFFLTEAKYTPLSSSIVRDVIRNGGSVEGMIPHEVNF
ncbi:MAG: pantetheine-phosphate adenylyltransferase [Lentimicrobiaceae bacterium]|jgi:pantetheine-phosphate adenylyltransferase|nr:pantetheine-phosphate adenylyltransferase [Lentimicrobiaceae bacterium]MDG1901632.1 pantetheine-phosphate adenylyltransferase [Bacteroidales bacterium]MDG2081681.1 pantetheine-phosphate adenylyltransferase [Bacteroidales bacterium]